MRYAIFSDVHGNLEALTTFFELIEQDNLSPVCLGDIAGYGANPNECLQMIREREVPVVIGNHDMAVLDPSEAEHFNKYAREAILWHCDEVFSRYKSYLYSLPWSSIIDDTFSIVHSDFTTPQRWTYVNNQNTAYHSFSGLETQVGFFGHTHIPSVFKLNCTMENKLYIHCDPILGNNNTIAIEDEKNYLINPGSLGQPRDRDPRASFMIYDTEKRQVITRRFQYDNVTAAEKIVRAGLPNPLASRLLDGV